MNKKKHNRQKNATQLRKEIADIVWKLIFLMIFMVYPIFYHDGYRDILDWKSYFITAVLIVSVSVILLLNIPEIIAKIKEILISREGKSIYATGESAYLREKKIVNIALILWMLAATAGLIATEYKMECITGSVGRRFGYLIFMLSMIIFAECMNTEDERSQTIEFIKVFAGLAGVLAYSVAIVNGLNIDILGMYEQGWKNGNFISTMGNRNSLAAYAAIFIPVAFAEFVDAANELNRAFAAIYILIAGMAMVPVSSDSVYLAVIVTNVVMLFIVCNDIEKFKRYILANIIFVSAGRIMGELIVLITGSDAKQGSVAAYAGYDNKMIYVVLAGIVFYVVLIVIEKKKCNKNVLDTVSKIVKLTIVLSITAIISLTVLSNMQSDKRSAVDKYGMLAKYMYFDKNWGTYRGTNIYYSMKIFEGSDVYHKLFGYGQGNFYYSIKEVIGEDVEVADGQLMVDGHNEIFDWLIQTGLIGLASFLVIIFVALKIYLRQAKQNVKDGAIFFAVIGYVAQGLVNNSHIYTFPVILLLIAARMSGEITERTQL